MMLDSYTTQAIAFAVVGSFLLVGFGAAMMYIGAYLQRRDPRWVKRWQCSRIAWGAGVGAVGILSDGSTPVLRLPRELRVRTP